ncbi:MAG TPA: N-methyl-L-tryptophan oxidase [Candidatus Dormibacteraeota bacterium]|nr:N-methyl-L-tryptophan oxidase [Candidatus Dormibacteraeota bacterium]
MSARGGAAYDAVVIGLGGMGSAALAHLASRGKRVVGLERFGPAHAMGSSHGASRIIRQAYFEHPSYVRLLQRAYELWGDLERRSGERLMLRTGGLMAGAPDSEVVTGSLRSAREHGLAHQVLEAADIRRRFPALRPLPGEVALYEEPAGVLFPEACILAHLRWAAEAGAEARFGTRVTSWHASDGGVAVETAAGERIRASTLVIAAGAWFGRMASDLVLPLKVERNVMHFFQPIAHGEDFGPDRVPVYILDREGVPMLYGFPMLPDQGLKAAFHHSLAYADPETIDRNVSAEEVAAFADAWRGWVPGGAGTHLGSKACMYTMTPDEHFVIGKHPAHENVVLAGGFSGHGFKFCAVVGEIVADLAVEGTSRHRIDLFAPERFARASG